jgi:hypothetical protein
MGLIELIVWLAAVGFLLWLVLTFIPMPAPMKQVLVVVVVIVLVLWLLRTFVGDIPLPRLRR